MNRFTLLAAFLLHVSVAPAQEPDPVEPKPEPTPREILADAVSALAAQTEVAFEGTVSELEPDGGFGGGIVIMAGGPGGGSEPFQGRFHVLRAGVETVVRSQSRLPGLLCYDDGNRCVAQATYEDKPVDASRLTRELPQLLDLPRLVSAVRRSNSVRAEPREEGATWYCVELSKRLVAGATGAMAMMSPRILSIDAEITLDQQREVTAMRFSILRSDPTAAMRRRALDGELGTKTVTVGEMEDQAEPGDTTVFELRRIDGQQAAELRAVADALRELLR